MASLGHVAIGMAAGRIYGAAFARPRSRSDAAFRMFALSAASLLPDADVVSFHLGIPYAAPFGHRGASHSLLAALLASVLAGLVATWQAPRSAGEPAPLTRGLRVLLFTALVVATHGPLDALTDGGEGVALLWPVTAERIFFPWRPIPVAPIGIHFLSRQGWEAARVELLAFAPAWLVALWPRGRRASKDEETR